jgi:VanZ family protein
MTILKSMLRAAAWIAFMATAFVTLASPEYRPTTALAHDVEHALAFALLGLLFGLGYPAYRLSIVLGAAPVIGVLEALQLLKPERHARLEDFIVNLATFWIVFAVTSAGFALFDGRRTKASPSQGS